MLYFIFLSSFFALYLFLFLFFLLFRFNKKTLFQGNTLKQGF